MLRRALLLALLWLPACSPPPAPNASTYDYQTGQEERDEADDRARIAEEREFDEP